jgi:glycosyltransferase involved in cell wall biosynthesis
MPGGKRTSMYPKISIVTPSYNQAEFIERTIESVLAQNYPELEYIVIDGGSTDGSTDIIKKYASQLSFWISEPDKGQSDAINKGFKKATGDLFCWINADDVLFPDSLKKVAEAYGKRPDVDIVTGNVAYIDELDYVTRYIKVPRTRWSFYRFGVGYFSAPSVFFKRSLYEQVEGLDINLHYSMDIDIWHKFRLAGAKVYHVKEYLGGFRVYASSKTGSFRQRERKAFENPETKVVRTRYIPKVSKTTVRIFRILYKFWQVANLNYLSGWLDFRRRKGKTWQEVFGRK